MKSQIQQMVSVALQNLAAEGVIPSDTIPQPVIERARDNRHGDFACNVAMVLAKAARSRPRDLAEKLVAALPANDLVDKVEIAGPGFINFYLAKGAYHSLVPEILARGYGFGRSDLGKGKRVQVEFVSANPTGPLHVAMAVAPPMVRWCRICWLPSVSMCTASTMSTMQVADGYPRRQCLAALPGAV